MEGGVREVVEGVLQVLQERHSEGCAAAGENGPGRPVRRLHAGKQRHRSLSLKRILSPFSHRLLLLRLLAFGWGFAALGHRRLVPDSTCSDVDCRCGGSSVCAVSSALSSCSCLAISPFRDSIRGACFCGLRNIGYAFRSSVFRNARCFQESYVRDFLGFFCFFLLSWSRSLILCFVKWDSTMNVNHVTERYLFISSN